MTAGETRPTVPGQGRHRRLLRRLWEALGHGLDNTANQQAETPYAIVNHARGSGGRTLPNAHCPYSAGQRTGNSSSADHVLTPELAS